MVRLALLQEANRSLLLVAVLADTLLARRIVGLHAFDFDLLAFEFRKQRLLYFDDLVGLLLTVGELAREKRRIGRRRIQRLESTDQSRRRNNLDEFVCL